MHIGNMTPKRTGYLSKPDLAFLPPFVVKRLRELGNFYEWVFSEDAQGEEPNEFRYYEIPGRVVPYQGYSKDYISPMNFWIAGSDNCHHNIHLGGSGVWIEPDNHYLFFEPVAHDLLRPEDRNPTFCWSINFERHLNIRITRITMLPQYTNEFPDGV